MSLIMSEQEYTDTCREIRRDAKERLKRLLAEFSDLVASDASAEDWALVDALRAIEDTEETLGLTAWVEAAP